MRLASRVVTTLFVVVGVVACSESPTHAHRGVVSLALAPQFSPQAQGIYRSLAAFAVTLDNVHVVVRGEPVGDQPGAVLKDTLVAFPATASQIAIEIELQITGAEQRVVATVDLQSGSTVYFEGTQELVARVGDTSTSAEPVAMSYVGPGASATSLTIYPTISTQPVTIAPLSSATFNTQAVDQLEHVVTNLPVTWRTVDPTIATVSAEGVVTATNKAGSTTLIATGLNGISAQATVDVQPATQLVTLRGENQSGIVGSALPVTMSVQALAANGHFVSGAAVNFAALNGAGTVSQSSVATDIGGVASTTLTLGQAVGTYTFTATLAGVPTATTRVTATATSGAAAALGILSGNNQSDSVAATLAAPLSVKVADAFGNPLAQQAVDFQVTSQNALLMAAAGTPASSSLRVTTNSNGVASVTLVGGTIAGTVHVTVSVPQTSLPATSFTETLTAATPTKLVVIQQPAKTAQATIPLGTQPKVQVADQFGNAVPLAGLEIDAAETCTRCLRASPPTGKTAPSLSRSASGGSRLTSRRAQPRRPSGISGPSVSRLAVPTAIARTQSISDTFPRGLGGKTAATTDAAGIATFSDLTLNEFAGPWQLEFFTPNQSVSGAFSDLIDLSAGPAASMIAWSVPDTSFIAFAGDSLFPSVRVIDKVGNGIPGVKVTWTATDKLSLFDSKSTIVDTQTDADGISVPGTWVTPVGTAGPFFVEAGAPGMTLENSPLRLWALLQPPIGRMIPSTQPTPPR
jgi:hypothetical protein